MLKRKLKTAKELRKERGPDIFWNEFFSRIGLKFFWLRFKRISQFGIAGFRSVIRNRICGTGLWKRYSEEATLLVSWLDFSAQDIANSLKTHVNNSGKLQIKSITWFFPDFQHAYYGGIYTLLRFADYFQCNYQVHNQFVIVGAMKKELALEKISLAFPGLADSTIHQIVTFDGLSELEPSDATVATLWSTAYFSLRFNETQRKFYFMQDYEPLFYPAGTTYGLIDASFRFGFYGIANTPTIRELYEENSKGGVAEHFVPCVDTEMFYPAEKFPERGTEERPYRIFFYGRPGHPRNSFELGVAALKILKDRLGNRLEVFSAGAEWIPYKYRIDGIVKNLGLLTLEDTAALYRTCDAGMAIMFTRHPSYLPFELMASGALVVTNYNPATLWMLKDGDNCLLSEASPTCFADTLERGLEDHEQRKQIVKKALGDILTSYSNWDIQMKKIFNFMINPLSDHENEENDK